MKRVFVMQVLVSFGIGYSLDGVCYVGMQRGDLDPVEDFVLDSASFKLRCETANQLRREAYEAED